MNNTDKRFSSNKIKAWSQLTITMAMYGLGFWLTIRSYGTWPLFILCSLITSLVCIKAFVLFHDCTHGSFHPRKSTERWMGRITGLICFTPFVAWKENHLTHHRKTNILGAKIPGEIPTLTADQYMNLTFIQRVWYRMFRHPLLLIGLGGLFNFLILLRIPRGKKTSVRRSVHLTNLGLALFLTTGSLIFGAKDFLMSQFAILWLTSMFGVTLFFVQHQFEGSRFFHADEANHTESSLKGSSELVLPTFLRWFTGRIELHHIHHLRPGVPNYELLNFRKHLGEVSDVKKVHLREILKCFSYKLYDLQESKLMGWEEALRTYSSRRAREITTLDALNAGISPASMMRNTIPTMTNESRT